MNTDESMLAQIAAPLLLDGPVGTELQRRGIDTSTALWSARALFESPDVVSSIHREYIEAGADIITVNSFRTNRRAVERAGFTAEDASRLTRCSVEIARAARADAGRPDVLIAGSDAPVEDCYTPDLVPHEDELRREHEEHIRWLMEAGCDLILIETMNTLREAVAASAAASRLGAEFMVSVVVDESGERLLSGESLREAAVQLAGHSPAAILINCASPPATLVSVRALHEIRLERRGEWRFGGYPNGGMPDPLLGYDQVHAVTMEELIASAAGMLAHGATIIGSCCGTTPEHTRRLRALIDKGGHRMSSA